MSDSYLNFANTSFGSKLTSMLGLPQPLRLERYAPGQAVINGKVLIGTTQPSELLPHVLKACDDMQAQTVLHDKLDTESGKATWSSEEKVKAIVYDASELQDSSDSGALYSFLHQTVRSIRPNGRLIILGRPPAQCTQPRKATVQRALEGLTRSLAKELRKGITVQLIYVEQGAEANCESSLRFFLSPRSAYVCAQVVTVAKLANTSGTQPDWSTPLAGKKVLVTGSSQGIGASIAETMARDGAELICLDIPQVENALRETAHRLNGKAIALDLSSEKAPQELLDAAQADGGWDVIVHNAGITRDKTIARMSPELWNSVVNVNLSTQERINDTLLDAGALRDGARIICVSSISGIAGNRGQTNYALSKAGVIGMVDSMAPVLAARGMTINAVAPGFIETKMTAAIPFAVREAGRRLNSMSQGGLPIDVAETIAWLASPKSNGLNGNVIRVCGQSLLGA